MNENPFAQNYARLWNTPANQTTWPVNIWKSLYFDCPVAVAAHFQSFLSRRAQEQMQRLSELSREQNPANIITKEIAFLQQASMAWNTEMMELAEVVQNKLLAGTQLADTPGKPTKGENHSG